MISEWGSSEGCRCFTLPCALCRASRAACLFAAAMGHPERLLCVFLLELTWPRPLQPGVGHFKIVSCIARTRENPETRGVDQTHTHTEYGGIFFMLISLSYQVQPCKHGYSMKYFYTLSIIITIEYYSYYRSKEYKARIIR